MRGVTLALALLAMSQAVAAAEPLRLFAAGSLKAALSEVIAVAGRAGAGPIETVFAASGTLKEKIAAGDRPDVFASANMDHPQALEAAGLGGPVVLFARNRLCALARPDLAVTTAALLDVMLDERVRLGTSTPKADPSGDYAFALFGKAETLRPGAEVRLVAKALQLTGGPGSPKAPDGRNTYAWVVGEGMADLFLTYCTNAALARAERPDLQEVAVPEAMAVGADYGLIVTAPERPEAWRLAMQILAPAGQAILARHGFTAPGLPAQE